MQPIDDTITRYFKAWNSTTEEDCVAFLRASCSPDILYFDPRYTCRGLAELGARIVTGRRDFPGYRVDVTSALDGYDDTYRYEWLFVLEAAQMRLPGLDIAVRAKDGKIASLTSFFGDVEAIVAGAALRVQPRFGQPSP